MRSMIDRCETSAIVLISRSLSAFVIKALLLLQISSRVVVHVVCVCVGRLRELRRNVSERNEVTSLMQNLNTLKAILAVAVAKPVVSRHG